MRKRSVQGFTLLEVLIALVVFTVGLLGLLGLQMTSLKLSHDSLLRTNATLLAKDMADRMRANPVEMRQGLSGAYHNPNGVVSANPNCLGLDSSGAPVDGACSSVQMAGHDFYEWYGSLQGNTSTNWHPTVAAQLPLGDGVVCIDSTPNDGTPTAPACDNQLTGGKAMYAIKVFWNERKTEGRVTRFVMSVGL